MANPTKLILFLFLVLLPDFAVAIPDSIQQKIDHHISLAEFDAAKNYIQASLDNAHLPEDLSELNYQLVKILFIKSDYEGALEKAFYSIDAIDHHKAQSIKFNFIIGCIYSAVQDYQKSIEYFDLVVQESKDPSLLVKAHLLSSDLYLGLQDSMQAKRSLTAAFEITRDADLDPKIENHVSIQYNFLNENYELCKQQNLAIIRDSTSFLNSRSYAYSMVGDCLIKQDSLIAASLYFDAFLNLTIQTKDPEQIKVAAKKLIEVYEKLGNQEKANTYHKIYNETASDSLSFSIEKYRDVQNVEKNRILDNHKNSSRKNFLWLGLGGLFIIIIEIYKYFFNAKDTNVKSIEVTPKEPVKKITVSDFEIEKIKTAIDQLLEKQSFLTPKITRKSFCLEHKIKSERYLILL